MGALLNFDLSTYGCDTYVETGTGACNTLEKALYSGFKKCYSIDLDEKIVLAARERFPQAEILQGLSTEKLDELLPLLDPEDSVLLFLDAHFPEADYGDKPYDVFAKNAVPLEEELQIYLKYRKNSCDYIICDDARIYRRGPFQQGNYKGELVPGGLDFIYTMFPKHKVKISYLDQGYILIDNRT